jgi:hypothetical protein
VANDEVNETVIATSKTGAKKRMGFGMNDFLRDFLTNAEKFSMALTPFNRLQ